MMTNLVQAANAGLSGKFRNLFKPRDIFFHDGKSLRRFKVGSRVQIAALATALILLAWSAFATLRIVGAAGGIQAEVAQMERQVADMQADLSAIRADAERRAAVLEQRQAFLNALLSGEEDSGRLASLLPQADSQADVAMDSVDEPYAEVDGMQDALV
ncbi:MAG TPA: M23 family peptidase, partial [Allosphingosinicella sp.]